MTQTLAHGATLASKYGSWGGGTKPSRPHPLNQRMMILSRPGSGKSTFVHGIEGVLVLNADTTSTGANTRAEVWPFVRDDGLPVDFTRNPAGEVIELAHTHIQEKVQLLIEAAKANRPRPRAIAFDTVDRHYDLIKDWMVWDYNRVQTDPSKKKEHFNDLQGKSAWPLSYQHFLAPARDLVAAGYGVIFLLQFGDKYEYVGDDPLTRMKVLRENVPTIQDNLYADLREFCDTVGIIMAKDDLVTPVIKVTKADGTPEMMGGQQRTKAGTPETVRTFTLSFAKKHHKDLKARVMVPDITLGRLHIKADGVVEREPGFENPWLEYERLYEAARGTC